MGDHTNPIYTNSYLKINIIRAYMRIYTHTHTHYSIFFAAASRCSRSLINFSLNLIPA